MVFKFNDYFRQRKSPRRKARAVDYPTNIANGVSACIMNTENSPAATEEFLEVMAIILDYWQAGCFHIDFILCSYIIYIL
jgi:hypothetical protein